MMEINEMATNSPYQNPVNVSLSKLTEGVGTIFAGVLTMLEALDADTADTIARGFLKDNIQSGDTTAEKEETHAAEKSAPGSNDSVADADDSAHDVGTDSAPVVEEANSQPAAPSITADDITKIIVQKIKQNRSNNQKIGALLKSYGASKVTELPEPKYEAFLTDLSSI